MIAEDERYSIKSTLGVGGFGSVYRAYDNKLHREVAIKRLSKGLGDEELREALLKEARVLASFQHPNIISIYDITSHEECDEIVMELAMGVRLDVIAERHLLLPFDLHHVALQILEALGAAHKRGVIHCDLKPENIMLCMSSDAHYQAKVYDFGMSVPAELEKQAGEKIMGSIYVMAPELFDGGKPSVQSDLYALGCVFYYLLTGTYPFVGDNSVQVMASHISGKCVALDTLREDLPSGFSTWLERLLSTERDQRFGSCEEAAEYLEALEFCEGQSEYTLSTTLELENGKSRVVRAISSDSLRASDTDGDVKYSNIYLANTRTHTARVRANPAVEATQKSSTVTKSLGSEEAPIPEGAEWYFLYNEVAKGPVTIQQLTRLKDEGKVEADTMIWHPSFGEWIKASACSDTREIFTQQQEIKLQVDADQRERKTQSEKRKALEEVNKTNPWGWSEVIMVLGGAGVVFGFSQWFPESLHIGVFVYAFMLGIIGYISLKLYQLRRSPRCFFLAVCLPFLGDIIYLIRSRNIRSLICFLMLLVGSSCVILLGLSELRTQSTLCHIGLPPSSLPLQ